MNKLEYRHAFYVVKHGRRVGELQWTDWGVPWHERVRKSKTQVILIKTEKRKMKNERQ